jgi:hypothetical protein
MQIGLVFPRMRCGQTLGWYGPSEGVEELGYTHVLAYGGCTRAGSTSTPRARLSTSRSSSWLRRGNHEGGTRHRRPRVATASDTARRKAGPPRSTCSLGALPTWRRASRGMAWSTRRWARSFHPRTSSRRAAPTAPSLVVAAEHLLRGCRRDRSKEAHGEHEEILEAVQDRDPEAAERVRSHFTNSLKSMLLSAAIP